MTQVRLNSLAILNCHKKETDKLDLVAVGNDFVEKHNERKLYFGKFVDNQWRSSIVFWYSVNTSQTAEITLSNVKRLHLSC